MKLLLLFYIFLFSFFSIFAQNYWGGITCGVTPSRGQPYGNPPYASQLGFSGGLTFDCIFKSNISLGLETLYQQEGLNSYQTPFTNGNAPYQKGDVIEDSRLNYVSLPLKAGYVLGRKFYGFGNLGFAPTLLLKDIYTDGSEVTGYNVTDKTKASSRFSIPFFGEIGFGFYFSKKLSGNVIASYESLAIGATSIRLGVRYNLGRS